MNWVEQMEQDDVEGGKAHPGCGNDLGLDINSHRRIGASSNLFIIATEA